MALDLFEHGSALEQRIGEGHPAPRMRRLRQFADHDARARLKRA